MMPPIQEGIIAIPGVGDLKIAYILGVPAKTSSPMPLGYLHSVRSEAGRADLEFLALKEVGYNAELPGLKLIIEKWAKTKDFDAVVRVPSSRRDAVPFAEAVLKSSPTAIDYSQYFFKDTEFRAGRAKDVESALEAISVTPFDAKTIKSLAIVDDSLNSGKSIAATLARLRDCGLRNEAEILLVVPLVLGSVRGAI